MLDPEQSVTANVFGQSVSAKGPVAIVLGIMAMALIGAGWLLYERSTDDRQAMLAIASGLTAHSELLSKHAESMANDHKLLLKATENLVETGAGTTRQLKIQNWIIMSNEKEKERFKMRLGIPIELQ